MEIELYTTSPAKNWKYWSKMENADVYTAIIISSRNVVTESYFMQLLFYRGAQRNKQTFARKSYRFIINTNVLGNNNSNPLTYRSQKCEKDFWRHLDNGGKQSRSTTSKFMSIIRWFQPPAHSHVRNLSPKKCEVGKPGVRDQPAMSVPKSNCERWAWTRGTHVQRVVKWAGGEVRASCAGVWLVNKSEINNVRAQPIHARPPTPPRDQRADHVTSRGRSWLAGIRHIAFFWCWCYILLALFHGTFSRWSPCKLDFIPDLVRLFVIWKMAYITLIRCRCLKCLMFSERGEALC